MQQFKPRLVTFYFYFVKKTLMLAREFCVASLHLPSRLAALLLLAAAAAATTVSSDLIVGII
jgi:hypothetical protein